MFVCCRHWNYFHEPGAVLLKTVLAVVEPTKYILHFSLSSFFLVLSNAPTLISSSFFFYTHSSIFSLSAWKYYLWFIKVRDTDDTPVMSVKLGELRVHTDPIPFNFRTDNEVARRTVNTLLLVIVAILSAEKWNIVTEINIHHSFHCVFIQWNLL